MGMTAILDTPVPEFSFKVTHVFQTGWKTFSQVCTSFASDAFSRQSGELCLKLYDERLFPHPDYRSDLDPLRPLKDWNIAEDMAKREEAAYDRLQSLQGTRVPHSYGFYYVRHKSFESSFR